MSWSRQCPYKCRCPDQFQCSFICHLLMKVHRSLNPLLEYCFLVCCPLSIMIQLAFTLYHVYFVIDWILRLKLIHCCCGGDGARENKTTNKRHDKRQENKNRRANKRQRLMLHDLRAEFSYSTFKNIAVDFIFEFCKLALLVMVLMSVTGRWKFANVIIFVIFFGFIILCTMLSSNVITKLAFGESNRSNKIGHKWMDQTNSTIDRLSYRLVYCIDMMNIVTYCITILCFANYIHVHWDKIQQYMKDND